MSRTNTAKVMVVVALAGLTWLAPNLIAAGDAHSHDRAYLGIHVGNISADRATQLKLKDATGALVLSIDQDGPACRAGLQESDVILALNGTKIVDSMQLAQLMTTVPAGKPATVTIWRNGQSKDVKVVPGSRKMWMAQVPPPNMAFAEAAPPAPPMALGPMTVPSIEFDAPGFTPTTARFGLMVESLSPQLADFFGVPQGQGVLVRMVQKGSAGANAGLKAGDVIVKVNGQEIHDIEDWRTNLRGRHGKITVGIVREKRQQQIELTLPGPANTSTSRPEDFGELEKEMTALQQQMQHWQPQIDQQAQMATLAVLMNQDELEQIQRDVDKSMKQLDPELKKQSEKIQKSMKQMEPQLRKQSQEIQKQMQKMQPEIERQTREVQKQMEIMGPQIAKQAAEMQKAVQLNAQEMKKLGDTVHEQMKTLGPELQKQMEEFRKQMQQMKQDWGKNGAAPNEL